MEGKKLAKVSSDKNLPKILYKDSEKKEIKEEAGHFMFNEGKINQEKFKDMAKDNNNNGNNF